MFRRYLVLLLAIIIFSLPTSSQALESNVQQDLISKLPKPGDYLTRGEYVYLLVRIANVPESNKPVLLPLDVPSHAWNAGEIKKALGAGIIKGSSGEFILPSKPITEAEAVVMLARALALPNTSPSGQPVLNLPKGHWAYQSYSRLHKEGIAGNGSKADDPLTPNEGAALLEKAFGSSQIARDICQKSQDAHSAVKTMRIKGTLSMTSNEFQNSPHGSNAQLSFQADSTMEVNLNQGLRQHFLINLKGLPQTSGPVELEQFVTKEGRFMKVKDSRTKQEQWITLEPGPLPSFADMLMQQSKTLQLTSELDKYFHYRLVGVKRINNVEYYDLAYYGFIPDLRQFIKLTGGQMPLAGDLSNLPEQPEFAKAVISVAGRLLINKELMLTHLHEATTEISTSSRSIINNYSFYYTDYYTDISINLPPEAKQ